ncbi:MAG: hypothetical protein GX039_02205 [Clostridia bacterium]|nr:hypothetical protein [Clostridia bacterium]
MLLNCPNCNSKSIGKINNNQYYCWDCFVEFNDRRQIFTVAEDGTLMAFER